MDWFLIWDRAIENRCAARLFAILRHSLKAMPPMAANTREPSFAGMLATATAPGAWKSDGSPGDGLADDVAVFSYEAALRHSAMRRPAPAGAFPDPRIAARLDQVSAEGLEAKTASAHQSSAPGSSAAVEEVNEPGQRRSNLERDALSARITIRLSQRECEQLRARAAESDMTLSAYLRSCTLEVENLRSQVKDAVAQLRIATSEKKPPATEPATASQGSWLARLWTSRHVQS